LTGTVSAFHTPGGFGHGLFFGVDSVVEVSGPVFFEIDWCAFMSDFIFLSVFLSFLSADDLIFLELRGGGKNSSLDFLVELGEAKAMEGPGDKFGEHLNFKWLISE
jgi:hypothetical protein